jgi:hypothetical protein
MNTRGFSIAQAMVTLLIVAFAALALTQLQSTALLSNKSLSQSVEADLVTQEVMMFTRKRSSCSNPFFDAANAPIVFPGGASVAINRVAGPSGLVLQVNQDVGNGLLPTAITLSPAFGDTGEPATVGGVAYVKYGAQLDLKLSKRSANFGATEFNRKFFFDIAVDPVTRNIVFCDQKIDGDSSQPLIFDGVEAAPASWACIDDIDTTPYCATDQGCHMTLSMTYKQPGYNYNSRSLTYKLYIEQPSNSGNNGPSFYGNSGPWPIDSNWYTGGSTRHIIANPWDWVFVLNYVHPNCPGQNGVTGPAKPAYHFSLAVRPYVRARLSFSRALD